MQYSGYRQVNQIGMVTAMYNYRCDNCGTYLDPGERCTCLDTHGRNLQMVDELLTEELDGQMILKETMKNGTYNRLRCVENHAAG